MSNPLFTELQQLLGQRNIYPSHQRLKILEYISQNRCHPTVEQIFVALRQEIPTLSKTTVYNTLHVLVDAGLLRVIAIDDNEARYDIEVLDHGHMKCERCGTIYNFRLDFNALASKDLADFIIKERNVYFKGVCPRCQGKPVKVSEGG